MRRWSVSCPYCKATIANGTSYGDSLPKSWLPFIRCSLCGNLVDTGSKEFLTMPLQERLKFRNTKKNADYILHSVSRTNNKKYQELLKSIGGSL